MKKLLLGLLGAALASSAWADYERGFYAGVGAAVVAGEDDTAFDDAKMPSVELIGGYKYNGALGLELRAGLGLKEDRDTQSEYFETRVEVDDRITQIDRETEHHLAIYYRPELVNETARLYGLLGYAELDTRVTELAGAEANETLIINSQSLSGPSYGAGVGFFIDNNFSVNFEFRKLLHKDAYRFETMSIYLDYRL